MIPQVQLDVEKMTDFCRRWRVRELALFGSVLRDDFRPDRDIDVLVSFSPDARTDLFDLVDMQDELSAIFGRSVDLVCREGIERSHNYIRRKAILSTAEKLYAA
jgi:uncharacterized protein